MKQLKAPQPAPDRPAERPAQVDRPSSSVHTTLALGGGVLPAVQAHTPTPANSPDAQVQHGSLLALFSCAILPVTTADIQYFMTVSLQYCATQICKLHRELSNGPTH